MSPSHRFVARLLTIAALAALAVVAIGASRPERAAAADVLGLEVLGGDGWHAENRFAVGWDPGSPFAAPVSYAIRDAAGQPIPGYPIEVTGDLTVTDLQVPQPGAYRFEAWRASGARAWVPLRFDDTRPAPVRITVPAWIAAGQDVPVALSHPGGPLPISEVAGYAVTLDGDQDGLPCAHPDHCASTELGLDGGIDDDRVTFPSPPEGIQFVHAAAVSGSGMASTTTATAQVGIDGTPPLVRLAGAPAGWATAPIRVTAIATDPLSGMAPSGPGGPITALVVDGTQPLVAPGPTAGATISGEGAHTVRFYGRDAVGNTGDGSLLFSHPGEATVQIDESGPTVRFAGPDPSDPERIEASVADPLSGPDPDRGSIAFRPVGDSSPLRPLPTDTRRGRLVARWDSDDYPRGTYEFRATAFDIAGNATTTSLGTGGAPFLLRNPVKREARLAFGFGGAGLVVQHCSRSDGARRCRNVTVRSFARRPAARTVPCCHGAIVGGRLVDADGRPLAGQTVELVEAFARGSRNGLRRTAISTDADGRFSTRLPPGPSRAVTAEFPGTGRLTRVAGRTLRLRVRAGVRLRVSTSGVQVGGPPVMFSGRIARPEADLPEAGLPVELEFRLPGMAWAEFRTVQSDPSGRFHYPYEFSDDDSAGVRFLFRAFVPATGNWPFAPATSRPVAVRG